MYNVKVITYPDLTKQVRVYKRPIETGIEIQRTLPPPEYEPFTNKRVRTVDDFEEVERSLKVSQNRCIDSIHRYARCNVWEWFVTFTFSKERVNRYDYDECSIKLSNWLKNMKKRYCPNMCYLIVPELHEDGAYHFHGLFSACEGMDIKDSGKKVIKRFKRGSRTCFRNTGESIYIFGRYHLGWMTATKIKSNERVVKYVTKYITKELVRGTKGKKRYWVSRNLEVPEEEKLFLDGNEKNIFMNELYEDCSYFKSISCNDFDQTMNVYELD